MKRFARLVLVLAVVAIMCGGPPGTLRVGPAMAQVPQGQSTGRVLQIRVEGLQRIEPETVRSYMVIRAGDEFDAAKVDESLKRLFGTGLFADVSIRRVGDILVVRVVENPVINRVAFEGNDFMEEEALRKEIKLRSRVVYTRTRVQNDVKRIIDLYSRQGRFAVTVVPKIIQRPQNRVDMIFEIDEGRPTLIRRISFIGNKSFSDRRLRSIIQSAETSFYAFLTADDVYDPDRIRFDEELLRRYYNSKGYADFRVLSTTAELSQDKENFFLTFTIEEGPRYRTGKVEIKSELKGLDVAQVRDRLVVAEGDWYNGADVEKSVNRLTDAVSGRGFSFIDVRPQLKRDKAKQTVDVAFLVRKGPRLFVERINISGNVRTLDRVIRRELRLSEGDPFNRARYNTSQRRVRALRFFKDQKFTRKAGSSEDKTVIDIEVEEQSTGSFSVGAGFSSSEGFITQSSLVERNLLGKGQQLRLSASLGSERQNFEISFTEPYFLNRNLAAGFDVFRTKTDANETISFDREVMGAGLRVGFAYNDRLRQGLSYRLESKEVSITDLSDPDLSAVIKGSEGKAVTSSVGQFLVYDRRDSSVDTREGYVIRLSNELAGFGGDNRFLQTEVSGAVYYEVVSDWVLRLGTDLGYIFGIGKDVRIDDRFFIGGDGRTRALRGFAVGGIGPRDEVTNDALGGNLFLTGTAELAVPFGAATTYQLKGFLFADTGTLMFIDDKAGASILEDNGLRASLGFGVGVGTPFGAIRFNLAFPVVKANFDETEVFSFRFGTTF
ncbi:MAG: outer membrane protein assembly factor BamA [Alphaproteobacteria bacterium]|nr:outer membrane protein assembly factor BamA [Alphaproteobacteria bacterium]